MEQGGGGMYRRSGEGASCSNQAFREIPFWRTMTVAYTPLPINEGVTTSHMLKTIKTRRPLFEIEVPQLLLEFERSCPRLTAQSLRILHGRIVSMYSESGRIFDTNLSIGGSLIRSTPSSFKDYPNWSNEIDLRSGQTQCAIYTCNEKVFFVHPSRVQDELGKLLERANKFLASSEDIESGVLFMAKFYLRFLALHPFDDGNGRVATMLWLYLSRRVFGFYVPFIPGDDLFRNYINQKSQFHGKNTVQRLSTIDGGYMTTYIIDCAYALFKSDADTNMLFRRIKMDEEIPENVLSALGLQTYWNTKYADELASFYSHGDSGEIWFGESVMDTVAAWAARLCAATLSGRDFDPVAGPLLSTWESIGWNVLDVGTGNGVFLHTLSKLGFSELTGTDYSEEAIQLANAVAEQNGLGEINFLVDDVLETNLQGEYKLVTDQGTLDAISLHPEGASKRPVYWRALSRLVAPGGLLVITSGNNTIDELISDASSSSQHALEYVDHIRSYPLAGTEGPRLCTVAFSCKREKAEDEGTEHGS